MFITKLSMSWLLFLKLFGDALKNLNYVWENLVWLSLSCHGSHYELILAFTSVDIRRDETTSQQSALGRHGKSMRIILENKIYFSFIVSIRQPKNQDSFATNIATAEALVTALDAGNLNWREFINPRSEYNMKKRGLI